MAVEAATMRSKKRRKQSFLKVFVITLVIAAVGGTAGMVLFNRLLDSKILEKDPGDWFGGTAAEVETDLPLTPEDIQILIPEEGMFATEFRGSKRVNILLLGNTDEGLSDTIMLVSFDPVSKTAAIINVPRDTYYYREGYAASWLKMNAVFHDGPVASAEAVHDVLQGIPINYYAVCSYEGVEKIIDAMGGVPFDVPFDMRYTSKAQDLYIDIGAGEQVLDGAHAVQLLRFRQGYTTEGKKTGYSNGDIGRAETQQAFMKATIKQALSLDKLPSVAKSVVQNVNSDVTLRALLYVVQESKGMDSDRIQTLILPGRGTSIDGLSFWQPADSYEVEEALRQIYTQQPVVEQETVTVGVAAGDSD